MHDGPGAGKGDAGGLDSSGRVGVGAGAGPGPKGEEKPDPNSVYALPYALVILAVLLGLLVVLRASNRRDREKPEEYESNKELSMED